MMRRIKKTGLLGVALLFSAYFLSQSCAADEKLFGALIAGIALHGYCPSPATAEQAAPSTTWIGVPDPDWSGVNPVTATMPDRPADWSSEVAGYYYVNNDTGTDSGRTYGTPSAPRATLPNPVPAGSYVELSGTYDYIQNDILFHGTGTASEPVWITTDTSSPATVGGDKVVIWGSYVYVDGIFFNDRIQISSSSSSTYEAHHICVRNCELDGLNNLYGGIGISDNPATNNTRDIVIYNNDVHDFGTLGDDTRDDHGIFIGHTIYDIWVLHNTVHDGGGSGIVVGSSTAESQISSYVYIAGNTVYNQKQSGIWSKTLEYGVISQNHVYAIRDSTLSSSPSKGIGAQYYLFDTFYLFNVVHDCRVGMRWASRLASTRDTEYAVIGNIVYDQRDVEYVGSSGFADEPSGTDTWDWSGIQCHMGHVIHMLNNTLARCQSGLHFTSTQPLTNVYIYGNIIYDITSSNGRYLHVSNGTFERCDFNVYYDTTINKWMEGTTTYTSIASWKSGTGVDTDSVNSDPNFTDSANNDYTLQTGSPAIDIGSDDTGYAWFQTLHGINIRVDYDGNSRPALTADYDAGAHEA